jgi:hypothetical protein
MAQHDYFLDNAPGAAFRSDLNNALNAVATSNSGPTAPGSPFANMVWFDTTNNLLKMRNATNSAWITIASKNGNNWIPYRNGVALGTASVQPDTRYAHRANNLSDLANAGTARNNLGLGTAAVRNVEGTVTSGSGNVPLSQAVIGYVEQAIAAIPEPVAWTTLPEVPTDQNLASHLVTGIPTSATEIEIILREVQLTGTQSFLIQLGNSGGVVTSGYQSGARHSESAAKVANSSGFVVANNSARVSLRMRIVKNSGNVWDASYVGAETFAGGSTAGAGHSSSIPDVDRIMLQRIGNTQFLLGVMIVRYR